MLKSRYTGCVYLATNLMNGRAYIGKTVLSLSDRKSVHHHAARRKVTRSPFHCAIRKYGADVFAWERLFDSDDEALLFDAERQLIVEYRNAGVRLYNVGDGGEGQSIPCSEERRRKASAAMTGRTLSDAHRRKLSERLTGRKMAPEAVEKMRQSKIGKKRAPWTEERRAKYMAAWARRRAGGLTRSPETRERMSEAAKRRCERDGHEKLAERGRKGAEKRWRG